MDFEVTVTIDRQLDEDVADEVHSGALAGHSEVSMPDDQGRAVVVFYVVADEIKAAASQAVELGHSVGQVVALSVKVADEVEVQEQ